MLYIIPNEDQFPAMSVRVIEDYVREMFPTLRSEWYWDDSDYDKPTEYGVKVEIDPNHPLWNDVVLKVARYCLCRGGAFQVPE
ncbi:MAG TPA: hypothetical protein VLF21_02395 [Candidatus Saccharimonadales bacterium]|nr:hypothetical protein [Candidatus Saccharimonadales bacterium]